MAYALENEAYRKLPQYLRMHHQIEILEKFVRTEIGGEEVNFFAKARQNGAEVVIIGESVLKLDDRGKLKQLHKQVTTAQQVYQLPALPLVVTHYARQNCSPSWNARGSCKVSRGNEMNIVRPSKVLDNKASRWYQARYSVTHINISTQGGTA